MQRRPVWAVESFRHKRGRIGSDPSDKSQRSAHIFLHWLPLRRTQCSLVGIDWDGKVTARLFTQRSWWQIEYSSKQKHRSLKKCLGLWLRQRLCIMGLEHFRMPEYTTLYKANKCNIDVWGMDKDFGFVNLKWENSERKDGTTFQWENEVLDYKQQHVSE